MPAPATSPRSPAVTGVLAAALLGSVLVGEAMTDADGDRAGRVASSSHTPAAEPPRESPYDAAIRELDCPPDEHAIWMTDSSQPPPGIGLREALDRYVERWDGRRTAEPGGRYAEFAVVTAGDRVVEVVHLEQWSNGSWSVEGGQGCRRSGRA